MFMLLCRLNSYKFPVPICNATSTEDASMNGNYGSAAEFYVFVGVMAFLYSIAALILYVFFDEKYRKFDVIPIAVSEDLSYTFLSQPLCKICYCSCTIMDKK